MARWFGGFANRVIPSAGLVFHAPLKSAATHALTGQTLTTTGTPTFQVTDGIPCMYLDGSAYIAFSTGNLPSGNDPFTISFWSKITSFSNSPCQFMYGTDTYGACVGLYCKSAESQAVTKHGPSSADDLSVALDFGFHHVGLTSNGTTTALYMDGVVVDSVSMSWATSLDAGYIGRYITDAMRLNGYIAAVRVFNRGLGASEMAQLSKEF